ncbi:glycosyl transferase [Pseudoclavibacter sp. AY1F1]|uniref:glycosyltransferase family 9 protein n=1 Tax=Pseudoclavibacter sp. AY1F1 TaxID=2080583 RepID=UPI000CE73916|nr:glycosyltransferase family 9 protein [Pseudoclavibacter sp. AY1F1]PPF42694.1 glycosyl transferase [Pseudoclavibacter sp. AY1F1]
MRTFAEPAARPDSGRPPTLLALRALKLGDLLVAVPALKALKRAYPDHELVYAGPAWLAPVLELIPAVDAHLPTPGLDDLLPLRPHMIDVAANLHGNGPESRRIISALQPRHRIVHSAPADPTAGLEADDGPGWQDGVLERHRWARLVNAFGADADKDDVGILVPAAPPPVEGAAVVHVGAFYGSRQWPVGRFAAVARSLAGDGMRVVVTGDGGRDLPRARAVAEAAGLSEADVLAGSLDLTGFAATIAAAAVVVTADTGAAHLASAYGTPSVVIFGPAPPEEWGPPPGPHVVLTEARLRRGDAFASDPDPALLAVDAHQVLDAARRVHRPR